MTPRKARILAWCIVAGMISIQVALSIWFTWLAYRYRPF